MASTLSRRLWSLPYHLRACHRPSRYLRASVIDLLTHQFQNLLAINGLLKKSLIDFLLLLARVPGCHQTVVILFTPSRFINSRLSFLVLLLFAPELAAMTVIIQCLLIPLPRYSLSYVSTAQSFAFHPTLSSATSVFLCQHIAVWFSIVVLVGLPSLSYIPSITQPGMYTQHQLQ